MAFPVSAEDQDNEIEEYIWNLMGRAGLLSELKSKVAQFIQSNGKTKENFFSVNFSRVNPKILYLIYEYLKWVGMKNTCTILLSESPVALTTQGDENSESSPSPLPQLCTYLAGRIAQADNQLLLNESIAASRKNEADAKSIMNPNTNNCDRDHKDNSSNNSVCSNGKNISDQSSNSSHPEAKTPSPSSPAENKQRATEDKEQNFEQDSFSYSKQYEKDMKDKKNMNKMTQKLSEVKLKPSTSDESLQHKSKEQHQFGFGFGFMTEKQKMEALNKKFSGTELTPLDCNTRKNINDSKSSKREGKTKEDTSDDTGKLLQQQKQRQGNERHDCQSEKVPNVSKHSNVSDENKSKSEGEPMAENKPEHPIETKGTDC